MGASQSFGCRVVKKKFYAGAGRCMLMHADAKELNDVPVGVIGQVLSVIGQAAMVAACHLRESACIR